MKRSDIRGITEELLKERETRKKSTSEVRRRIDLRRASSLQAAIQQNDVESVKRHLVKLAIDLEDGLKIHPEIRSWLGVALTELAIDPSKGASVFGLARAKGRVRSNMTMIRDIRIAEYIHQLPASMHIHPGRGLEENAALKAAKKFNVSESVAERAWKKWGADIARYAGPRTGK